MVITGLALQNFRLHKNFTLKFPSKTTVIVGDNAMGKTSIVEALALLSTGDSFKAGRVEEMVDFNTDLSRVKGVIVYDDHDNDNDEVEVILTRGEINGKKTQHRLFSVNGVKRRKKDAIGKFYTVVFRPEDMRLIEGSPSRRRSFLDTLLSMIHPDYEAAFKSYEQTLRRRNKLLLQVREREQPRTSLQYWNINLARYGEILQKYRKDFVASFTGVEFPVDFEIEYDPSVISDKRIEQYIDREIASGHTLVGPHKDDIIVFLTQKGRRLRLDTFGSRGQQRLGVLWIKFCELEYITATVNARGDIGKRTLLLLDDILSELDNDSKALALSVLKNYQSIITTTDKGVIEEIEKIAKDSTIIRL
ncbi:AAA family ATPase [Patescibacteria group bacterium]|nr:AAA family ATPase [Patescibacteria group bacterium]